MLLLHLSQPLPSSSSISASSLHAWLHSSSVHQNPLSHIRVCLYKPYHHVWPVQSTPIPGLLSLSPGKPKLYDSTCNFRCRHMRPGSYIMVVQWNWNVRKCEPVLLTGEERGLDIQAASTTIPQQTISGTASNVAAPLAFNHPQNPVYLVSSYQHCPACILITVAVSIVKKSKTSSMSFCHVECMSMRQSLSSSGEFDEQRITVTRSSMMARLPALSSYDDDDAARRGKQGHSTTDSFPFQWVRQHCSNASHLPFLHPTQHLPLPPPPKSDTHSLSDPLPSPTSTYSTTPSISAAANMAAYQAYMNHDQYYRQHLHRSLGEARGDYYWPNPYYGMRPYSPQDPNAAAYHHMYMSPFDPYHYHAAAAAAAASAPATLSPLNPASKMSVGNLGWNGFDAGMMTASPTTEFGRGDDFLAARGVGGRRRGRGGFWREEDDDSSIKENIVGKVFL
ncbi:hypothetical protein BC829DRAFT_485924 [Chytridium lagenaria]|nr:hypothetical protein BC829DRAFT_485924 [Chytridium lagenaria]